MQALPRRVLSGGWSEVRDWEGVIVAPIDMRITTQGLYDFDPVGHYSRPDVFKLSVDTRAKPPVDFGARRSKGSG
jgi:nitrilase